MGKNLVVNPFWDDDAAERPISFADLLRRAAAGDEPSDQPTREPIRFLGVELPWEFMMPTVVTGVPHGFELYRLALTEDGAAVEPASTGPDPAAAAAWRDSRSWRDNLRELVSVPAEPFMPELPFWMRAETGALANWSSSSASAGGMFGLIGDA